MSETTAKVRRAGLQRFGPEGAALLHETSVMSMPVMDPLAPEQMLEWATSGGYVVKVLFGDPDAGGMSLVWSWFAPHYVLPRHSHSADCMYYVTKGELHLGNQVVGAGEGFFVPANAPYAYAAGPDGVEILEFRSTSSFDMRISESLGRWSQIVDGVRAHRDEWAAEASAHT
jgi:quercetin dioxygenase-like cupin family protein